MSDNNSDNNKEAKGKSKRKLIIFGAIFLSIIVLFFIPPVRETFKQWFEQFNGWVGDQGIWAYPIFILVYIVCTVAMLPGSILTAGAGIVFGWVEGTIVVSIASVVGASLAFLIARYAARSKVENLVSGNEKFQALDKAVGNEGFKIVFLTRLTPVFPFNLQNYGYGLTNVSFWKYFFASWIGMLPGTAAYVFIGAAAGQAAQAAAGTGDETSIVQWITWGIAGIATIAVTVVITKIANKSLKGKVDTEAIEDTEGSETK